MIQALYKLRVIRRKKSELSKIKTNFLSVFFLASLKNHVERDEFEYNVRLILD